MKVKSEFTSYLLHFDIEKKVYKKKVFTYYFINLINATTNPSLLF